MSGKLPAFFCCILIGACSASAASLTGSVSFSNGLYTYSYAIDNSTIPVNELIIDFASDPDFEPSPSHPISETEPSDWDFVGLGILGGIAVAPPVSETGWVWSWFSSVESSSASGFSFTTTLAPGVGEENNYFLYSLESGGEVPDPLGGSITEFGHVVAPAFTEEAPEPSPIVLLGLGIFAIAAVRRRLAAA